MPYIESNVIDLDAQSIDMTNGDSHLQEIADESGIDYETYHSSRTHSEIGGHKIESFYDECGSIYRPWKVFCMGQGTFSGESREDALGRFIVAVLVNPNR